MSPLVCPSVRVYDRSYLADRLVVSKVLESTFLHIFLCSVCNLLCLPGIFSGAIACVFLYVEGRRIPAAVANAMPLIFGSRLTDSYWKRDCARGQGSLEELGYLPYFFSFADDQKGLYEFHAETVFSCLIRTKRGSAGGTKSSLRRAV